MEKNERLSLQMRRRRVSVMRRHSSVGMKERIKD
jgi:hypothetical protein